MKPRSSDGINTGCSAAATRLRITRVRSPVGWRPRLNSSRRSAADCESREADMRTTTQFSPGRSLLVVGLLGGFPGLGRLVFTRGRWDPRGPDIGCFSAMLTFSPQAARSRAIASGASRAISRRRACHYGRRRQIRIGNRSPRASGPRPYSDWPRASCHICYSGRPNHPARTRGSASSCSAESRRDKRDRHEGS
jgi:hypothetical protein